MSEKKKKFLHDISNKLFLIQCYIEAIEKDPKSIDVITPKLKKASNEANSLIASEKEEIKKKAA